MDQTIKAPELSPARRRELVTGSRPIFPARLPEYACETGTARKRRLDRRRRQGMTLVEIMAVLVIIAMVAGAVGFAVLPTILSDRKKGVDQNR